MTGVTGTTEPTLLGGASAPVPLVPSRDDPLPVGRGLRSTRSDHPPEDPRRASARPTQSRPPRESGWGSPPPSPRARTGARPGAASRSTGRTRTPGKRPSGLGPARVGGGTVGAPRRPGAASGVSETTTTPEGTHSPTPLYAVLTLPPPPSPPWLGSPNPSPEEALGGRRCPRNPQRPRSSSPFSLEVLRPGTLRLGPHVPVEVRLRSPRDPDSGSPTSVPRWESQALGSPTPGGPLTPARADPYLTGPPVTRGG